MTASPSSTTVPAYTEFPSTFLTGTDSPVREAWFTIASPSAIKPSNGTTFPICTTTISPAWILSASTNTSVPSLRSHTLPVFRDMVRARSSTDFLWVHSSSSSPIPSRNITEPAVEKSPRKMETPIAVASRTGTSILRFQSVLTPSQMYFTDIAVV